VRTYGHKKEVGTPRKKEAGALVAGRREFPQQWFLSEKA
jgi:hypothetical protein